MIELFKQFIISANSFTFLQTFIILANIVLGLIAFLHAPKERANRFFALMVLSSNVWIAGLMILRLNESFFGIRLAFAGASLLAVSLLKFTISFSVKVRSTVIKILENIILAAGLFFVTISLFGSLVVKDVVLYDWLRYEVDYGPFYKFFSIFYLVAVVISFSFLSYQYFHSEKLRRRQLLYLTIGMAGAFILGTITNLIIPLVTGKSYYGQFGPFSIIIFLVLAFYTIVRHELLNIKMMATEFFVAILVSILFLEMSLGSQANLTSFRIFVFGAVLISSFLLIRNALKEVKHKEELARINDELDKVNINLKDLNKYLQQKVDEQTIEIRKAYEVEKKARVELEELDKAKDQFILTTQHHLRTPLTIIKGYIGELLKQPVGSVVTETVHNDLEKTNVSVDRLGALVNEFLDISQIEVEKNIVNKEMIDIKEIVQEITEELHEEARKRNLTITINIAENSKLNVDKLKLKEALTNLIDNAMKYNKEGGSVLIKGERTVHPIEKDKYIFKITIQDSGIGLTQEELSHLFTQYFERGVEAEKIYTTGRGIGLAITKNIITAHQGRIYAESDGRDKGARFVIELPV